MTRHTSPLLTASLTALALASSAAVLPAVAAPAAPRPTAPAPSAPTPATPATSQLDMVPSTQTVAAAGTTQRVLYTLPATKRSFTMAAMTFGKATGKVTLQVRTRNAQGWQEWHTFSVEATGASAGEGTARQGTDLDFFGPSTEVEARILTSATTPGAVTSPRVSIVNSEALASDATVQASAERAAAQSTPATRTMTAAAASYTYATQPTVISRAGWGADEGLLSRNGSGCVTATIDPTIKAAIVHNTAGTNNYTAAQSASIVRGIYAYHVVDRGWCDIGYNFLVDQYGQIFEGRHGGQLVPVHGAHATSWNTETVGVSVMMDSNTAAPTPAAMSAVTRVIAWKLAGNYRDPKSTLTMAGKLINRIARHGDVMDTDCPGKNITAYMPTLRNQVAAAMGNWKTPIYASWQAQGGESGSLGAPHILERPWNGGRTTTFIGGGIYQTSSGATYSMSSAINNRYLASDAFGKLGWPIGSQVAGSVSGSSLVRFAKGTIYHTSGTGARITTGAVDSYLKANPSTFAQLGYPTGEAVATSSTSGYQMFRNGRVNWDASGASAAFAAGKQGDQNGDSRADVLAVNSTGVVTWYPTGSDGVSGAAQTGDTLAGAPFSWLAQTPDVNGDGYADLIARRTDGTLWAWDGRGKGHYANARQVGVGWKGMREINVVPDMNSDGLPEIVAISSTQQLMRYGLGRNLAVTSTAQIGRNWGAVVHMPSVGDFRRVGVTDILGITSGGLLLDYAGSRTGSLSDGVEVGHGWGSFTGMHSIGDINADGYWDLVGSRATGPLYGYVSKKASWGVATALVPEVSGMGTIA